MSSAREPRAATASGFVRIACRGAPRDLGLDQGRACAREIARLVAAGARGAFASLVAALRPPAEERGILRATSRYFPHLAERTAGLARGASVSVHALAAFSAQPERAPADALRVVKGARGACVARALPADALVVLRESAPDTDYRSLELVAPQRLTPSVGVNEHGLALAAVLHGANGGDCAAPASLLAQECLQRFDRVEKALEWLERRPAGGRATFVLADATSATAAFEIHGSARRRTDPSEAPISGSTSERCCVVIADPAARALAWTFADGASGEAGLGTR